MYSDKVDGLSCQIISSCTPTGRVFLVLPFYDASHHEPAIFLSQVSQICGINGHSAVIVNCNPWFLIPVMWLYWYTFNIPVFLYRSVGILSATTSSLCRTFPTDPCISPYPGWAFNWICCIGPLENQLIGLQSIHLYTVQFLRSSEPDIRLRFVRFTRNSFAKWLRSSGANAVCLRSDLPASTVLIFSIYII